MEEMVQRWLDANKEAEEKNDWKILASFYTDDATYGWNTGAGEDFMAVGLDEIRDVAIGLEMQGLEGWTYPYQKTLIDDRQGEVIGLWKQVADARRPDGSPYEVVGIGGSWFRYAGNFKWSWQRDFMDYNNVAVLFMEMMQADALSPGMKKRIEDGMSGQPQPGHYRRGTLPVSFW